MEKHDKKPSITNFDARTECPVDFCTVYSDRAEVIRTLKATLAAGRNELVLSHLAPNIDGKSVRVSGGQGNAIILEVSHEVKTVTHDHKPRHQEIAKEVAKLTDRKRELKEDAARIVKEANWIGGWASQFMNATQGAANSPGDFMKVTSTESLAQVESFLDFYQKRLFSVDSRLAKIAEEEKTLDSKIKALQSELPRSTPIAPPRNLVKVANVALRMEQPAEIATETIEKVNEVIVLVEAKEDNVPVRLQSFTFPSGEFCLMNRYSQIALQLSYIIYGASWNAAYDARVDGSSGSLHLTYHGVITNSTGEDWKDVELSLSTAKPAVGGAPPPLSTKWIGVDNHSNSRFAPSMYSNALFQQAEFLAPLGGDAGGGGGLAEEQQDVGTLTTTSKEGATSTTFLIPRQSTILSDDKPHKVAITVVRLDAQISYTAAPQLTPHAYLKASVKNTTANFPFLQGDMLVFIDNNFIAKSQLKQTQPGESFTLFLGTDSAVKIESEPVVRIKDVQGIFSKSNIENATHKTVIRNTKSKPISISVFEQLPRSNDGSVKVKLVAPIINEQTDESALKLTDANSIRWKVTLEPGKKMEFDFAYRVEYPQGMTIKTW